MTNIICVGYDVNIKQGVVDCVWPTQTINSDFDLNQITPSMHRLSYTGDWKAGGSLAMLEASGIPTPTRGTLRI